MRLEELANFIAKFSCVILLILTTRQLFLQLFNMAVWTRVVYCIYDLK